MITQQDIDDFIADKDHRADASEDQPPTSAEDSNPRERQEKP
jgi:hypothetical protein